MYGWKDSGWMVSWMDVGMDGGTLGRLDAGVGLSTGQTERSDSFSSFDSSFLFTSRMSWARKLCWKRVRFPRAPGHKQTLPTLTPTESA